MRERLAKAGMAEIKVEADDTSSQPGRMQRLSRLARLLCVSLDRRAILVTPLL